MRKFIITALVALCAVLPGRLDATSPLSIAAHVESAEIDPTLVEVVLKEVAEQEKISYEDLSARYAKGEIVIEKVPAGYAVLEKASGGGLISILIDWE